MIFVKLHLYQHLYILYPADKFSKFPEKNEVLFLAQALGSDNPRNLSKLAQTH